MFHILIYSGPYHMRPLSPRGQPWHVCQKSPIMRVVPGKPRPGTVPIVEEYDDQDIVK